MHSPTLFPAGSRWHRKLGRRCANYSPQEWGVTPDTGGLKVFPFQYSASIEFPVEGGRFLGTNRGESGGSVEWLLKSNNTCTLLLEENPVAFVEHHGDVFVATGLAHLGQDGGAIFKL